jgi:hypothetical protein
VGRERCGEPFHTHIYLYHPSSVKLRPAGHVNHRLTDQLKRALRPGLDGCDTGELGTMAIHPSRVKHTLRRRQGPG